MIEIKLQDMYRHMIVKNFFALVLYFNPLPLKNTPKKMSNLIVLRKFRDTRTKNTRYTVIVLSTEL